MPATADAQAEAGAEAGPRAEAGAAAAAGTAAGHPWWHFAALAVVDVEANACLVAAYRYTSLTR
jgi:hypothetical protein